MPLETTSTELETRTQVAERDKQYRAIIKLLVNAFASAIPATSPATAKLKALADDIDQPMEDFKIGAHREALEHHREALEQLISGLEQDLQGIRQPIQSGAAGPPPDSATGLPGPASAQQLIGNRLREGKQTYAAVLVLDQLRALKARFGRAVGDDILIMAAQDLDSQLSDAGILHRWRGPAFLVICTNGPQQAEDLGKRMKALLLKRLEKTLVVESRSIHVKLTFTWHMEELSEGDKTEAIARRFDDFVSTHTGTSRGN